MIKEYRGAVARRNKLLKLILAILGAVIVLLAIISGAVGEGSFWGPMLIVLAYLLVLLIVFTVAKYRSSYKLRMSQFLISVFCRVENNRHYLRRGVEVRPGFTGKWIEFRCLN